MLLIFSYTAIHMEIVATISELVWHLWVHAEHNRSSNLAMERHGQRQVPVKCIHNAILWNFMSHWIARNKLVFEDEKPDWNEQFQLILHRLAL